MQRLKRGEYMRKCSHQLLVCSLVEVWYEHLQVLISAQAFLFLQINPHKIQLQLS